MPLLTLRRAHSASEFNALRRAIFPRKMYSSIDTKTPAKAQGSYLRSSVAFAKV